ncbi:MAG: response regulator transcription factor [Pseudomonadota bacterium]|jgi:DNA-binding NarL/FixJ family response regulator
MNIEVLVADDHAIIRDGLKKILADTDDMVVAGEATNGVETLEQVRARDWSVVVLDLSMPGRNGLELIRLIRSERPKLPILVFSMHSEEQFAVRAIRSGASGYLTKESDSDLLLPAIRKVAEGGVYFSQKVMALLAADVSKPAANLPHLRLTDREFDIFMRIVKGVSPADIAADLSLSVKTVSSHKSHIIEKMGLSSQVELVRYAIEHGLLDTNPE